MVSIFKAVKDNNVDSIRDLIQLMTGGGGGGAAAVAAIPSNSERRQQLQRYLKATGQKQFNFNRRSIYGRTALHCAASWNRIDIVRLLLECPLVNVNVQDRENGWTALHRALYCGHLIIALELLRHPDIDLNIKDWEGIRPVELLMITLGNTKPLEHRLLSNGNIGTNEGEEGEEDIYSTMGTKETATRSLCGGTDLYTWGSNTNYVLGHSDSENRMYPERVHLNLESQRTLKIMARPDVLILDVRMSKYHTAVLTSEPRNNLLLCGFGHGGRLGNGKQVDTQLRLVPVQWPERISAVALGKDHTVAVSERGNVITFGSNEHCQLGYETEDKFQFLPRKIQAPSLKRQAIIGAAASAVHTVVYTAMDIFTFGYNQGQLGYHASGDEVHQLVPRKVAFSSRIKDVAATDYATALLFESHDIVLLCNFNQQKIILPTDRFPMNIRVHSASTHFAVKLLSGGEDYMGALSNNGDVYVWSCRGSRSTDKTKAKNKPLAHVGSPKRAWTPKKSYLEATDSSIGHHGDLVVSTRSGQVFAGQSTKEGSYKFNMIPNLQRCIRVSASPSGAFAAIRSEVQVDPIRSTASTFVNDIATALPHVVVARRLEDKLAEFQEERNNAHIRLMQQAKEEDQDKLGKKMEKVDIDYESRVVNAVHLAWQEADELASKDETLDAAFVLGDGSKVYCHCCILGSRSRFLAKALRKDRFEHPSFNITLHQNRREIRFSDQSISLAAILHLVDWLYTDTFAHPMGPYYDRPAMSRACDMHTDSVNVQKDLVALAALFELEELCDSASRSFSNTPRPSLMGDLLELLKSGKGTDVSLELKDGQLTCHEVILRQRCSFFGALFEPGSIWMQARREGRTAEDPLLHIAMTHTTKATVEPLLRYLYGDLDEHGLFDDMTQETPEAMMRFLVEMLCLADELLLLRLKTACERALAKFLKLRSATTLLEAADQYMADALKDACLQFISTNLDIFMATGMLDHLNARLIRDIEVHVQQCQADEMPNVRRPPPTAGALGITKSDHVDDEFSTSLYTLSREDQPIATNYIEVYTTILPEPEWASKSSDEEDRMFPLDEDQPVIEEQRQQRQEGKGKQHALAKNQLSTETMNMSRRKLGWAVPGFESTETKMSFRAIMEQQPSGDATATAAPLTTLAVAEQSGTSSSSLGKSPPRYIPKKMSQKERRKLQQQQQQQEQLAAEPKPVWGKVATSAPLPTPPESLGFFPPVVTSCAIAAATPIPITGTVEPDLANTTPLVLDGSSKGKKIYVSKEEFMNESLHHQRNVKNEQESSHFDPIQSLGSSFLLTPIRRQRGGHVDPHQQQRPRMGSSTGSFHAIQKQQELEDLWIKGKQARKSLVRIQMEERAIESLKEFYVQTLDATTGEWVDIDRLDPSNIRR